jgi:hypothetical protein
MQPSQPSDDKRTARRIDSSANPYRVKARRGAPRSASTSGERDLAAQPSSWGRAAPGMFGEQQASGFSRLSSSSSGFQNSPASLKPVFGL